jgi:hypothetical protein
MPHVPPFPSHTQPPPVLDKPVEFRYRQNVVVRGHENLSGHLEVLSGRLLLEKPHEGDCEFPGAPGADNPRNEDTEHLGCSEMLVSSSHTPLSRLETCGSAFHSFEYDTRVLSAHGTC